jgi:flavin-dependent dehydrogenase
VDASGRAGVLSRQHFNMRHSHEVFRNTAIWAYWEGARLHPDSPEGAINVFSTAEGGWFWHIPLGGGRFSVGYVLPKQLFALRRDGHVSLTDLYLELVHRSDVMRRMLDGAIRVTDARAEQDYSYVSERFCGPGYVIVGDAACFLDPLLSTGVHLAMYASLTASAAIASILRGQMSQEDALGFFDYSYRRSYSRFLALVSRMYTRYGGAEEYFGHARDLAHTTAGGLDTPRESFTRISAGLTDICESRETGARASTDVLIDAAALQDDRAKSDESSFGGLDMFQVWKLWRDPLGPDTAMGAIRLTTDPVLGLTTARRDNT